MKPRTGVETASATRSEYSSATPFGTSSPTTTWRNVMIRNASVKAISEAKIGSKTLASTCSPSAPIARLVAVTPSCIAAMKRAGSADDPHDRAGPAVALLRELLDPRPARRDEPVLGRHEIGVQQDQRRDAEEFQEKGHAPLSGARVLGGFSSNWIYVAV